MSVAPVVIPGMGTARLPIAAEAPRTSPLARPERSYASPLLLSTTSCDALGCTASDGTRLTRSGPLLMGPRGACTVQGSVLNCP